MEKPLQNNDILTNLGWNGTLAILPFDHRTGLYKIFDWTEPLTEEQVQTMKAGRRLIYDAIKKAVADGIPKEQAPVFTDDIFGKEVLLDAKSEGFNTFLTTEKSGTPFFDFEHGDSWQEHITSVSPTFTKALVRYNPDGNKEDNQKSLANLKKLSDFSHANGYKFVIEPLVPATEDQLASVHNEKSAYDETVRPELTKRMIEEFQGAGVEPDIWKIEGFKNSEAYALAVSAARRNGRDNVGVISLGRNETDETVEAWLRAGAQTEGVIGFAIGRTIFLESLVAFTKGACSHDEAVETIANKLRHFYDVFVETKNRP